MMTRVFNRWRIAFCGACALLLACLWGDLSARTTARTAQLCMQSYTFHRFTLEEALHKSASLGIHNMEVFPGHRLGGPWGDMVFGPAMSDEARAWVRKVASECGVRIVAMGVCVPDSVSQWSALFDFARRMDIRVISCEPLPEHWDAVERLSRRTGIRIAVHNHPQPSRYWHPDSLLHYIASRDARRIGSCADVGHWRREGIDPLHALHTLRGRVVMLHFKDIVASPDGDHSAEAMHDTIWGEGILFVAEMLSELRSDGFNGYLSIEYEYNWENSLPDLRRCLDAYRKMQP